MTSNALKELVDRDAERATLGACLIDNSQLVEVADILRPEAFTANGHRHIFRAMLDLFEDGQPIDLITLADSVRVYTDLDRVGNGYGRGTAYLAALMTGEVFPNSATHYAKIVADLDRRRNVIRSCQRTVQQSMDRGVDIHDIVETGTQSIITASLNGALALKPMGADLDDYLMNLKQRIDDPIKKNPGLDTGFIDIDRHTAGLEKSKLYIIASRPAMGKTAWLIALTCNLSLNDNKRVAIFSLEMSREELYNRILSYEAKVNLQRLAKGDLTTEEEQRVIAATRKLIAAKDRIWIDDTENLTMTQVRARAQQMMMAGGVDYLWLDFLQLVSVPEARDNYYIQATSASRDLKNLSKNLNIPVVAASQLNREVEKRNNKRPQLSDLRDSGGIEEAADLVAFLYRDSYYHEDSLTPTISEFIIAKQRNGPMGLTVEMYFAKEYAGFLNLKKTEVPLNL